VSLLLEQLFLKFVITRWHKNLALSTIEVWKFWRRKFEFMANIRHPNFILGIVAILLHGIALGLRTSRNHQVADILTIVGSVLMLVSWVWSVFEVQKTDTLQGSQKKFWLIAVISIPFAGGMLYHILHSKRNTIVD
jgi:hypothetical protein